MKACRVFGILMAAGMGARAEGCTVTVYVHAAFNDPEPFVLIRAEIAAADLFRDIGVAIRWRTGAVRPAADGACGAPIEVSIGETAGSAVSPHALANATPFRNSGTSIHVFADRVSVACGGRLCAPILAYVLAHEITHVLEGVNRHSAEGVMKAQWEFSDYRLMQTRKLSFAAEDVDLIHRGLVARMRPLLAAAAR